MAMIELIFFITSNLLLCFMFFIQKNTDNTLRFQFLLQSGYSIKTYFVTHLVLQVNGSWGVE